MIEIRESISGDGFVVIGKVSDCVYYRGLMNECVDALRKKKRAYIDSEKTNIREINDHVEKMTYFWYCKSMRSEIKEMERP